MLPNLSLLKLNILTRLFKVLNIVTFRHISNVVYFLISFLNSKFVFFCFFFVFFFESGIANSKTRNVCPCLSDCSVARFAESRTMTTDLEQRH